ncbi:efflux RND transporter periplasmic adaptor subunit [Peristeroidobacter agariperforans]|uniref:efflux RND transporter periplasmic adaptor subunit n=1 Tax=Peristeroidobacter agariperforans TaxID=268404 RepID=UPI00101D6855|nr:HlyD family efflux transporter periplasmic adaptor subunit [Peristeroidobacter agariperforans]
MDIARLRSSTDAAAKISSIRGTAGQDTSTVPRTPWHKQRLFLIALGVSLGSIVLFWLVRSYFDPTGTVPAERLRLATVSQGHFIRDVAAEGAVIAAVSPTLFAAAVGTISYQVQAGDTVTRGQVLATLDSPATSNEYQRERATLESMNVALDQHEIEGRRQILRSQQQADLSKVSIAAAEREFRRAESAWKDHVFSENDYERARDNVDTAKLNYEHALQTAALERDSVALELRTRRLERDRQKLLVEDLHRRVADLTVHSPVDGMVASLAQVEKAKVAESAPLLTVVDLSALEVEFQIAELYARDIKPGMPAQVTLEGRPQPGIVTTISPEVRQSQVKGRVKFAGAQPPRLRQNQRAAVRIILDERDGVLKFERGPLIDDSTRAVYVINGDRAEHRLVELGAPSVSEIEVLRGLVAGDRVVISDMRKYRDAPDVIITD